MCRPSGPAKTNPGRIVIVRFCVLASGSAGNCAFLATPKTRILIDAGLSVRELTKRLAQIGESPDDLDAVFITHEHSDHVSGLPRLIRYREKKKKPIPVFVSKLTSPQIDWNLPDNSVPAEPKPQYHHYHRAAVSKAPAPANVEAFQAGSGWMFGNIAVQSFTIPHDATDPCGFTFQAEGIKVGIATDLGYVTDSLRHHLRRAQMLLLESNHDLEMLKVGPYPWSVKQRVMGRNGHLSNGHTCEFLENDLDSGVQTLILGHLSEHNNHPEIVRIGAEQSLEKRGLKPRLVVAEQKNNTEVFTY